MTTKKSTTDGADIQTPVAAEAPSAPLTLDMAALERLAAIVASTVIQTLQQSGALNGGQQGNLGEVIGNAVAEGMTKSTRRRVSIGEYLAKLKAGRPILARKCWQNDKQVPETIGTLSNREIDLLNGIHRTGRYINRLVEVVIGMDGAEEVVYLRYNDKGDHKFALSSAGVRNFETMLEMITAEAAAEDEAEEAGEPIERKSRSRSFGSSKRTQAAREAAEARA